jgi:hypothetical protein
MSYYLLIERAHLVKWFFMTLFLSPQFKTNDEKYEKGTEKTKVQNLKVIKSLVVNKKIN